MKPLTFILAISILAAAFIGGMLNGHVTSETKPQHLSLEQILSIKELHLVKHVYQDLFFLHKKNDQKKPIRAIVQVPVEITAYLNLKEIKVMYENDSIKEVVLPHAQLNTPLYKMNELQIRETRTFQVHAGKDHYPLVSRYLGEVIAERMEVMCTMAIANRILRQAEEEGKAYVESLLKAAGREDITIRVGEGDQL
jgi:hypothetical protein